MYISKKKGASIARPQKPLRLLYRIILASTNEGDTVLDPFSGSGTTGIAANLLSRKYIGIEQDQDFVQLSLQRRQALEDEKTRQKLYDKMRENPQETKKERIFQDVCKHLSTSLQAL